MRYKDLMDNEAKQRYLDAMEFLATAIKEATDKNPTERVLKMGTCMREVMMYVTKLECDIKDADHTVGVRIRKIKDLEKKTKYLETEVKHLKGER